jgi:hypothetical protein
MTDLATSMAHVKAVDEAVALDDFVRVSQAAAKAVKAAKAAAAGDDRVLLVAAIEEVEEQIVRMTEAVAHIAEVSQ